MIYTPKLLLVSLIEQYRNACNQHEEAYKESFLSYNKNLQEGKLTPEYSAELLKQARARADENFKEVAEQLHDQYVAAFARFTAQVEKAVAPKRAADHAARVSVALQLLQIEKSKLTDQRAASILRGFIEAHDFEDLAAFHRVVELQINGSRDENGVPRSLVDVSGGTTWPLTFGSLNHYEQVTGKLTEAQDIANDIFTGNRAIHNFSSNYRNAGEKYLLPVSSYRQLFIEEVYPEQLDELQAMLNEFFTVDVPLN